MEKSDLLKSYEQSSGTSMYDLHIKEWSVYSNNENEALMHGSSYDTLENFLDTLLKNSNQDIYELEVYFMENGLDVGINKVQILDNSYQWLGFEFV